MSNNWSINAERLNHEASNRGKGDAHGEMTFDFRLPWESRIEKGHFLNASEILRKFCFAVFSLSAFLR
jgi:hypothetical protein